MIYDYMISEDAGLSWRTVATGLTRSDVDQIRSAPTAGDYRRWFYVTGGHERYWHRPHRVSVFDQECNAWRCVDGFHLRSDAEAHAKSLSHRSTTRIESAPEGIWE